MDSQHCATLLLLQHHCYSSLLIIYKKKVYHEVRAFRNKYKNVLNTVPMSSYTAVNNEGIPTRRCLQEVVVVEWTEVGVGTGSIHSHNVYPASLTCYICLITSSKTTKCFPSFSLWRCENLGMKLVFYLLMDDVFTALGVGSTWGYSCGERRGVGRGERVLITYGGYQMTLTYKKTRQFSD